MHTFLIPQAVVGVIQDVQPRGDPVPAQTQKAHIGTEQQLFLVGLLMRAQYGEHFLPNVISTESASRETLGI